jgi:hypothetical protein
MNWSALTLNWWLLIPSLWSLPALYFVLRFCLMVAITRRAPVSVTQRQTIVATWAADVLVILALTAVLNVLIVAVRVLP